MPSKPEIVFQPLYTVEQAASISQVPVDVVTEWAQPPDFIISLPDSAPGEASVSFTGMVELLVLAIINPDQDFLEHFYPALPFLEYKFGRNRPVCHYWFKHDGPKLLWEYYNLHSTPEKAVKLLDKFHGLISYVGDLKDFLFWAEYNINRYTQRIQLPQFETAPVLMDPENHSGFPYFREGGSKVEDVINSFLAGNSLQDCSMEYDVPVFHIEDVLKNKDKPFHNPPSRP